MIVRNKKDNPQETDEQYLRIDSGDSVGIRTQGLLLRRQLLYPAELRNPKPHTGNGVPHMKCACKGMK